MHPARIAELLEPFLDPAHDQQLTAGDLANISTYVDILLRWNARINLTAIREPDQIVTRHFGESLFAARRLFPNRTNVGTAPQACPERSRGGCPAQPTSPPALDHRGTASQSQRARLQGCGQAQKQEEPLALALPSCNVPTGSRRPLLASPDWADATEGQRPTVNPPLTVADLGSGAGFPGIPLKLWAPEISLTLIESNHRKVAFLREVARALTLTNVNILHSRATSTGINILGAASPHPSSFFDLVTLRAVERFPAILPIAANLVRPPGRLALLIGSAQLDRARHSHPALAWSAPLPIPQSTQRILLVAVRPQAGPGR